MPRRLRLLLLFAVFTLVLGGSGYAQCLGGTSGTSTNKSYLLNNEFQDGRPAGSITPGCIRDFVASSMGNKALNLAMDGTVLLPTGGDDTAAINAVLAAAKAAGKAVYAPAGTYKHAGVITVDSVCLFGDGPATIFNSTDATGTAQAIELDGSFGCLRNLKTTTNWTGARQSALDSHAIAVNNAVHYVVQDVTVSGSAAGGMFNYGSNEGKVIGNRVLNTQADGIHVTHGSHDILISGNYLNGTGDDCLPVISYTGENPNYNIRVEGNTCVNGHARGLAIAGGHDVVWVGNLIENTSAAGMYINAESDAQNIQDILVSGNKCILCGSQDIGQASIYMDASSGDSTTNVTVTGNEVSNALNSCVGLGVGGSAATYIQNVNITGNTCAAKPSAATLDFALVGGTEAAGNVLTLTFTGTSIPSSPVAVRYTEVAGDTAGTAAWGLAQAVNANTNLLTAGISAMTSPDGQGNCDAGSNATACPVSVYGTVPSGSWTLAKTVTGAATITLSTGGANTGNGVDINAVTNLTVSSNHFIGPWNYAGVETESTTQAGTAVITNNLFSDVDVVGGANAAVYLTGGFTSATITGNVQQNNGATPTDCILLASIANAMVQNNQCDQTISSFAGVTAGYVEYPNKIRTTQTISASASTVNVNFFDRSVITVSSGSLTGQILQAGSYSGQKFTVMNNSANALTWNTTDATAHISGASGKNVSAHAAVTFTYDTASSLWY